MCLRAPIVPLLYLTGAACLGSSPPDTHAVDETREESEGTPDNAIVLDWEALRGTDDWLLYALASHVPSIRVNFNPERADDRCPRVSLRGPLVGTALSNPLVYVNGTRTSDTCILVSIRSTEVERVEVYPAGFTGRSGYTTHPHGLILVFTRRI